MWEWLTDNGLLAAEHKWFSSPDFRQDTVRTIHLQADVFETNTFQKSRCRLHFLRSYSKLENYINFVDASGASFFSTPKFLVTFNQKYKHYYFHGYRISIGFPST